MRKLKLFLSLLMLICFSVGNVWADTYEQLTSIDNIDGSAQYVLGIDGTGFHYEGTSSWGKTALPSAQTPIYYTLTKASDGKSFTAQATISSTTYYLQVPTTNTFGMVETAGTNTDLIIGTTQVSGTNYAVANKTTTARHLRINGTSGLRSYAGTTGTMAFFYKVVADTKTLSSLAISGDLSTKSYEEGQSLDFSGLTVTGTYSDESQQDVTSNVEWSFTPALAVGTTSYIVTATIGEISDSKEITGVTVSAHTVTPGTYDDITLANALWGTSYTSATTSTTANSLNLNGSKHDIQISLTNGSATSMYITDTETRAYKNYTLTFAVPTGYNITKITFTKASKWGLESASGLNTDADEWTGKANSVSFSFSARTDLTGVTVTYAAIAPEVTATPNALEFEAKQNIAVAGKTFTLTGANLESGLTLAASTGFSVSPTEITAEAAMAQGGVEVTVTPATPTAATTPVEGTVTISGGGIASNVVVNLSMAVTETYAVNVAVNENAMGTATINGGTDPVYAEYAEKVALVATPETGYEFVSWSATTDDIEITNATSATTTATIGAAGTITATFQAQVCKNPKAPTLNDAVAVTYNSATINWNAVTQDTENNDIAKGGLFGYAVTIKQGENVIVNEDATDEVSYTKDDLAANTTYHYIIMSVGNGPTYCEESNPTLEGDFTTSDYPAATLSLVENGGAAYAWGGENLKMNDVIALPTELTGLGCTGKVLVGWDADENCATAPTYAKGANYTLGEGDQKLYAVFATEQAQVGSEHSVFATTALGTTSTVTDGYSITKQGENKTGYVQDGSGTAGDSKYVQVKVTNTATQIIPEAPTAITVKATIGGGQAKDPLTNNVYAVLIDADQNAIGDPVLLTTKVTAANGSEFEASMPIANYADVRGARVTHAKEASYNVRYYSLSLSYTTGGGVSYSGYTTECDPQLTVLDAPTFSLEAGSYYDALQSVSLTATDEADIYYTLDGTEPSTSSTKYTAAIALDARGEYTIKAIAAKEGFETSEFATRTYNIVLPYDFADFAALDKSEANGKEFAVRGIISQKGSLTSGNQLPYYISADGQTTGQIKCHNGLKLNKETFTSADDVNLGDNVTVVGTWSTQFSNLNAGNWMLEYTARVHDTYVIEGELTASSFDNGDAFDAAILNNLTVKETFTNGYYENVDDENLSFNAGEKTAWAEGDTKLTVNAVLNEEQIATKDFAVSVTAAALESIALKADDGDYQTKVVYYLGDAFVAPTIVATLDDASSYEAAATLVSGFDNENAGEQEVTVSYTRGEVTKEVSYNITMKAIFNNEDAPHTVAKAIELIEASDYQSTTSSTDYMWVRGKVVGFNGTSNNRYYISDDGTATDQLYVFNGKYFNDAAMNATNKPAVGDEVILKATILNYNGNTAELTNSVVVYQLREGALSIEDVTGFEVGADDLNVTVTTASDGDITFVSGDEEVVTIVDGNLHAVAAGTATITANLAATANEGAINYTAASTTFSVTVIATLPRYTVTFDANGGTGTDPVIADQLEGATVELPANPYSKENSAFAGWLCDVDGQTYETGAEYTMTAANVKFTAQWNIVATCAISFQIGGQEVATANAPQTAEYTFTQVGAEVPGFTFLGWSETEVSGEVEELPTIITSYTPEAGESSLTLYGIYSRVEGAGETNHYVLDYAAEGLADNSNWGAYTTTYDYTAADGGAWTIKAFKSSGMQINTNKSAYIKVPACPAVIKQVELTCNSTAKKAVKFCATASDGAAAIATGSEATTQTLDLSSASVTTGYIIPTGNCQITHIDVAYDAEKTYYTSSPVEKVTVTFALDGGEGGCQTTKINKGGQLTICADVPTKEHSEFAGWKNGDDVYEAGQAYTFNADITLTAQWNTAAQYTVTYVKGGDETGDVPTDNNEYFAGDQVTVLGQGTLAKSGYEFQGWLNGNKLYAATATFAMPAENVTLTAQWRKENITTVASEKMALITDASGLINGMVVALGCTFIQGEDTTFAMAGGISNKVMTSVTEGVSLSNGIATFTSSVVMMIAEQVENGWKLRKDAENYLQETKVKELAWGTVADATVWTISFNNGNAVIASGNNTMKFNKDYPRFTTYASGQTAIQLYGKAIVVTDDVNISDLGYVGEDQPIVASGENVTLTIDEPTTTPSITATNGATVVIDAPTTAQSVNVEEGSKIEVNEPTTTPVVTFATTLGSSTTPSTGAALGTADNITLAAGGEIHYDITLGVDMTTDAGKEKAANQWHAFTVPFPVDVLNGIYNAETGAKLTNEVDYAIMDYHGDIRANGQYGWKKYRGTLVPGTFYIMTVNGDVKTFRFKMSVAANTVLQALNSMAYTAFGGTDATNPDYGWNGIGNPSWVSVTVAFPVQVLDPYSYEYQALTAGTVISASTPFFYKANTTSTMTMTESNENAQYAPARTPANEIKNVAVSFGNEVFADKLYVTASEDALNSYEQDKDLVKMRMSKTPKVAQIFADAYGMKLSMVNTPLVNDKANVALDLYAPEAGEYTISVPAVENYTVYLTREGKVIWNLSMSEYTAEFAKGNNEGYGIRIVRAPQVGTDIDNIYENASGVQKVVIDEHVYILRGEQMFDVTGKSVK